MDCPYCDESISPLAKFCPKCGLPLKDDATVLGGYVSPDAGPSRWVIAGGAAAIVLVMLAIGWLSSRRADAGSKTTLQMVRREPVPSAGGYGILSSLPAREVAPRVPQPISTVSFPALPTPMPASQPAPLMQAEWLPVPPPQPVYLMQEARPRMSPYSLVVQPSKPTVAALDPSLYRYNPQTAFAPVFAPVYAPLLSQQYPHSPSINPLYPMPVSPPPSYAPVTPSAPNTLAAPSNAESGGWNNGAAATAPPVENTSSEQAAPAAGNTGSPILEFDPASGRYVPEPPR